MRSLISARGGRWWRQRSLFCDCCAVCLGWHNSRHEETDETSEKDIGFENYCTIVAGRSINNHNFMSMAEVDGRTRSNSTAAAANKKLLIKLQMRQSKLCISARGCKVISLNESMMDCTTAYDRGWMWMWVVAEKCRSQVVAWEKGDREKIVANLFNWAVSWDWAINSFRMWRLCATTESSRDSRRFTAHSFFLNHMCTLPTSACSTYPSIICTLWHRRRRQRQ